MQSNEPGSEPLHGAPSGDELSHHERSSVRLSELGVHRFLPTEEELRPCAAANDSAMPASPFGYVPRDLHDAIERWLPRMRRMAAAWALSHEVDDLLQDIWLELHRSWSAVITAQSPLAMALEIAKRRCHKALRKKKAVLRSPVLHAELPSEQPARDGRPSDPERQAAIAEDVSSLHAILATLNERQRDAFLCRRVHGMTGEETAQVLKTTTRAAYALEEEARMKIEAEWKRRKLRGGRDEQ